MQEKNGWVTEDDNLNHHFPVMSTAEANAALQKMPYSPPREEYYWSGPNWTGRPLKIPEEVIAHFVAVGAVKFENVPKHFQAKVEAMLPAAREEWTRSSAVS
jgi:hypothetical protein